MAVFNALIWLIPDCWNHYYSSDVWQLFYLLSIDIPLLAENAECTPLYYHNMQRVFFLPLTLIYTNLWFECPTYVRPNRYNNVQINLEWSVENRNFLPWCFPVVSASEKLFTSVTFIFVDKRMSAVLHVKIISSYVGLYSMTFISRKLRKFSDRGWPTKIHSLKHHKNLLCM